MNTMQTSIAKIKETGTAAAILTLVIFILVVISFVLTVISGIKMAMEESFFAITEKNGTAELATTIPALAECIKKGIELILFAIMMFFASRMFRQISADGTPFRIESVRRMKRIAILLLINAVLPNLVQCLIVGFSVSWKASSFSLGLSSLFLGLIFYLLTQIFSYGCILQQESDDTV